MNVPTNPVFPITVVFENGEVKNYEDVRDLELNLEHFDSEADDCSVRDAMGREVRLKLELLTLQTLELA